MKFSARGAICATLLLSASIALAKPRVLSSSRTATNYSNAADGYSIFLPGKPKESTTMREFAGKKIPIRIVSATSGGFSFAVITTRAPAGVKSHPPRVNSTSRNRALWLRRKMRGSSCYAAKI